MALLEEGNCEFYEHVYLLVNNFSVRYPSQCQYVAVHQLTTNLEHILLNFGMFLLDNAVLGDLDVVSDVHKHVDQESTVRLACSIRAYAYSLLHNLHEWL
jgi:hypothetical protein